LLMKFLRCASSKFFFTSANLKSANFYKILHNFVSKQFWNSSLYTFYIYKFELGHFVLYICKRELTVSLDNVSTQARKNVYI
jgi:hypothetical protein